MRADPLPAWLSDYCGNTKPEFDLFHEQEEVTGGVFMPAGGAAA